MSSSLPRLGVDLVEIKKAKAFYKNHKNRLDTFFFKNEIRYIKKNNKTAENLALLLATKEAVFKSLSLSWMGPAGFKNIQVLPGKRKLTCRLDGAFRSKREKLFLESFHNPRYVVVKCAGIS